MTENKGGLIRREALKEAFARLMWKEHNPYDAITVCDVVKQTLDFINNAPAVTPSEIQAVMSDYLIYKSEPERPHGKWEYNRYDGNANIGNWHCSECRHIVYGGYSQKPYYNFCPNCWAAMRGGRE